LGIELIIPMMKQNHFGRIINIGFFYASLAPTPRLYKDSKVLQTPSGRMTVPSDFVPIIKSFYNTIIK